MGTTPKPLLIIALSPLDTWGEIVALKGQGHEVLSLTEFYESSHTPDEVDLFLGPTAWRMDESHRKYLPLAIAEGRRARYPVMKGKTKK